MRIRIKQSVVVTLEAQPGDEIVVQRLTPALDALLRGGQVGGAGLAELVDDDGEVATVDAIGETATTRRGHRGSQRPASVS